MQCPPRPGPGIERLEPERLGLRRLDHLPDVDTHPIKQDFQLIDQRDIHSPIGVLEDLARLGDLEPGNRHDPDDHPAVEGGGHFQAGGIEPADDLGNRGRRVIRIAGVLTLGTEGEEEVRADRQAPRLEDRQDDVAGRSGIGGALEDDELPRPEPIGDRAARGDDVAEVRVSGLGQGGRHADDDGVGLVEPLESIGRLEPVRLHRDDRLIGDVTDVAPAQGQTLDLGRIGVEAEDGVAGLGERPGQRQTDITKTDDPDLRRSSIDRLEQPGPLVAPPCPVGHDVTPRVRRNPSSKSTAGS